MGLPPRPGPPARLSRLQEPGNRGGAPCGARGRALLPQAGRERAGGEAEPGTPGRARAAGSRRGELDPEPAARPERRARGWAAGNLTWEQK